jgi:hypothetical protein
MIARSRAHGLTAIEAAIGIAILGSILAIAIPACVREMHASKFVEPTSGLERIGKSAVARAEANPGEPFLVAPLTPANVPRGKMEVDPAGTWDHPAWRALEFRASADGIPHAFSFETTVTPKNDFFARAHGDLDGDGQTSTFEIHAIAEGTTVKLTPGMYVESEVE